MVIISGVPIFRIFTVMFTSSSGTNGQECMYGLCYCYSFHAVNHKIFARSSHGVLVHKSKNFTNI